MWNRIKEYLAFTKNEQRVFFFLAVVFLTGVAIKVYKSYVVAEPPAAFDYTLQDSLFQARSQLAGADTLSAVHGRKGQRRVNINTATKTELLTLPGVGEATAERILLLRGEMGSFKSVQDLKKVKGIGEKKFEKLKPYIEVQ